MSKASKNIVKSREIYSTFFESSPNIMKNSFQPSNFLASKDECLKEMNFRFEELEESHITCSNNPYLFKESTVISTTEALRDKISELC